MKDWRDLNDMASELGRVRGWAPGEYMGKCMECNRFYLGDKRSTECLPCAVNGLQERVSELYSVLTAAKAFTGQLPITDLPEPQVDRLLSLHGKLRHLLETSSDVRLKSPKGDTAAAAGEDVSLTPNPSEHSE